MPDAARINNFSRVFNNMFMGLQRSQKEAGFVASTEELKPEDFSEAYRLTNHFVVALKVCGYISGERLEKVSHWVLEQPLDLDAALDHSFLNRLELLVRLYPDPEMLHMHHLSVDTFQLLLQRLPADRLFCDEFEITGLEPNFSNLWAASILVEAYRQRILVEDAGYCHIRKEIDQFIRREWKNLRPKDQAWALRLRYLMHNRQLQKSQRQLLVEFLNAGEATQGWWNLKSPLLMQLPDLIRDGLTHTIIGQAEHDWRDALLSTCYTIENLAPLKEKYTEISEPLNKAFDALCGVMRNAPQTLYSSFSREIDRIMILSRVLVAAQAFAEGEFHPYLFSSLFSSAIDNVSEDQEYVPPDLIDREGVLNALRNWFEVSYDDDFAALTRGFSGARVVRIKPHISIPVANEPPRKINLPDFDSVVVKYGPVDEIQEEIKNYEHLHPLKRNMFARLRVTHTDKDKQLSFIVIQDLMYSQSLEEYLPHAGEYFDRLCSDMLLYLDAFHRPNGQVKLRPNEISRTLYLEPAWRYTNTIFNLFRVPAIKKRLRENNWPVEKSMKLERDLRSVLVKLYSYEVILNYFPPTYMHGDMHSRNIMVKSPNAGGYDFAFHFIDLEKFMAEGDYACDVGELSANLDIFAESEREVRTVERTRRLEQLLQKKYEEFAHDLNDGFYPIRFSLAKARTFLRIAHGKSKQGTLRWEEGRILEALDSVYAALQLADRALEHLANTYDQLREVVPDDEEDDWLSQS